MQEGELPTETIRKGVVGW
jgi:transposase